MGFLFIPLSHFDEEEDVEEVHASQHQKNETDLGSEDFEDVLVINHRLEYFEKVDDEAEVDEIEPDDEQMVNAVGEVFAALAAIDQENPAVFMKGAGHPDRERQGDDKIEGVSEKNWIHGF